MSLSSATMSLSVSCPTCQCLVTKEWNNVLQQPPLCYSVCDNASCKSSTIYLCKLCYGHGNAHGQWFHRKGLFSSRRAASGHVKTNHANHQVVDTMIPADNNNDETTTTGIGWESDTDSSINQTIPIDVEASVQSQPEERKDDWIYKYGNKVGVVPTEQDLHTKASFAKDSKSPTFYWCEYNGEGDGIKGLILKAFNS